ncbi:MAG TPA: phosphodiester glycosidase family protein [Candidatus Udaeobacter sp.]|nr:phosphodiester glycosidase family protein [Candidatus Udaeobacter sp.]
MQFRFVLFLSFAVVATAHGEWAILSNAPEPGRGGVVHRHVVLENGGRSGRVTVDVAIFSTKSCTLQILPNRGGEDLAEVMKRENCFAGVNGGYFDEKFAPLGLRIVNSQMIAPLRRARLITGVLFASSRGVEIARSGEFSPRRGITAAVQCGPFLVDRGQPIAGLNNSKSARRTFAATTIGNPTLVGVCSQISLAELSGMLATTSFAPDLKIERALNLDGGSSTAFWFAREDGSAFSISEQKPVQDFVGVIPK